MYFFLPTLYKEDTGYPNDDIFVRVGKNTQTMGHGECWCWVQVQKFAPGLYRSVGPKFFDIKECYRSITR